MQAPTGKKLLQQELQRTEEETRREGGPVALKGALQGRTGQRCGSELRQSTQTQVAPAINPGPMQSPRCHLL